ncbi:ParB family protein [uncultured Cetobacterium sp.]|uniref:ParB family protein n=1 Tax=uncultured Cetobacterium sp. TaxID=527638 RepID=UPI00262D7CAF|nr:ParB family protein [uncultured Cetobacterium sp.]
MSRKEQYKKANSGLDNILDSNIVVPGVSNASVSTALSNNEKSSQSVKVFTLKNGDKVNFYNKHIGAAELKEKTEVPKEINPRLQDELTIKSIEKIAKTIGIQQFYPAIAYYDEEYDKYFIIDGSRRLKAAIEKNVGLDLLYSLTPLSIADGKYLADAIQTAEKLTAREEGMRFSFYLAEKTKDNESYNQKMMADDFGCSESHISKCLVAASIDSSLIKFFPNPTELSHPDYRKLKSIQERFSTDNQLDAGLVELIGEDITNLPDVNKESVFKLLGEISPTPKKAKDWNYLYKKDSRCYARTIVSKDKTVIEMQRMPKKLINQIHELINKFEPNN